MCILVPTYTQQGCEMRTNIVIDDKLMSVAIKTSGLNTKKEVVEEALKLLIKVKNQGNVLIDYFNGKENWQVEKFDEMLG